MPDVAGLFDSFLEAAVSLAVLFVIVAWISSKIVELGQLTFNVHGKMLRDELERCFGEEGGSNKGRFTHYFYWHPMIVPLTQPSALVSFWRKISGGFGSGGGGTADDEARFPPGRLPGHIAPESFAAVVMNPFPWPTTEEPLRRLLIANLVSSVPPVSIPDDAVPKLILEGQSSPAGETWKALIERAGLTSALPLNEIFLKSPVDMHSGPGGNDPAEHYVAMCRANELVPHPLETRIVTMLRDAGNDLDDFRAGLRRWYAEAMARVTGRFKRTALIWVFFVALIICTLFNLNAISLFSALMKSPELRAAGVAASQAIGTKPGGIEALGQKAEYAGAYKCVDSRDPPRRPVPSEVVGNARCKVNLLHALWRDSRRTNAVGELFSEDGNVIDKDPAPAGEAAETPDNSSASAKPPPSPLNAQVETMHGLCEADTGLCGNAFRAKLNVCIEPAGDRPEEQCKEAWRAIWASSGLFWHPEAAQKLALSLTGGLPDLEAARLPDLLYNVKTQADAETGAVTRFLGRLPEVGPVWADRDFKGWNILWTIFGVLLSALLAALGAPFWYDVLGKLSRRGTSGARGEKT